MPFAKSPQLSPQQLQVFALTDHCKLPDLAGGAQDLQTSSVAQGFHEAQLTIS